MRQQRAGNRNRRRGAALVEMALVLPVFLTIVLGIIEFGRAMTISNLLANAAREGARLAVTAGTTNTEVTNAVKTFMNSATGVAAGDVTVTITVTAASGNPDPGNNAMYTIVKFVGIRILDVKLTGGNKYVTIQPAPYVSATVIPGNVAVSQDAIFAPPALVK